MKYEEMNKAQRQRRNGYLQAKQMKKIMEKTESESYCSTYICYLSYCYDSWMDACRTPCRRTG